MRFDLTMKTNASPPLLTLNYQYPLSAAIYKIIQKADSAFAGFLHNTGYGSGHKSFKLFTFSDINTPFTIVGDRMQMLGDTARLTICFYMPQAAENFIKGLFMYQQLEIADRKSRAGFVVQQVENIATPVHHPANENMAVVVQPLSPIVTGRKNDQGYYDYRSPHDADFTGCLLHNWLEKYRTVTGMDAGGMQEIKQQVKISVQLFSQPFKQRLVAIKQGTDEETRIRGYTKFRLRLTAPGDMIQLALDAGLGLYNSQGMGCVEVV